MSVESIRRIPDLLKFENGKMNAAFKFLRGAGWILVELLSKRDNLPFTAPER
jgi:hypothetical protein